MTVTLVRQIINSGLLALDLCFLFFIARHLLSEWRLVGWPRLCERLGNRIAIAIGIHIFGLSIVRAWSALLLWYLGKGIDPIAIETRYPIALIGAAIALVGMIYSIKVFSEKWGNWGWIVSLALAAGFTGTLQFI